MQAIRKRRPKARKAAQPVEDARSREQSEDCPDGRAAMIADAAYFRAEKRDFTPGHELEDWLAAEREVDKRLARTDTPAQGC